MPYNTRRKSLSLPSLGIHLPVSQASRAAAAAEKRASIGGGKTSDATAPSTPAAKTSMSPPSLPLTAIKESASTNPKTPSNLKYEHTPPPSPEAEGEFAEEAKRVEIDLEGINDDIVEAVIVQLQKTANRPHLVKELAAILGTQVKIVETSANPSAIISSRLSTYLKRSCWSNSNPCPLAKELETVHPRRTYFYLTTYPHQPIPDPASLSTPSIPFPQRSIISPSLSSADSSVRSEIDIEDEDAEDMQRRRQLSPSPEVDLSSSEFDDVGVDDDTAAIAPPTPSGSFSGRLVRNTESGAGGSGGRMRGQSPPLEKDEREFTLTARGMQRRRLNRSRDSGEAAFVTVEPSRATSRHDFEGELFGERHRAQTISVADSRAVEVAHSSPVVRPTTSLGLGQLSLNTAGHSPVGKEQILGKRSWEDVAEVWIRDEDQGGMWDSRSPEMVDLEELDGLFSGY